MSASHHAGESLGDVMSEVLPQKLYFSGYPSETQLIQLAEEGFTHILDLTDGVECPPYETHLTHIRFPIADHGVPTEPLVYCHLLSRLLTVIRQPDTKVLVHCRGGHGRSGMACVSLWILWHLPRLITVNQAITVINEAHIARVHLRMKWRTRRMPFNHTQASFLHRLHKIIYLVPNDTFGHYGWVLPRNIQDVSSEDELRERFRTWLIDQPSHACRLQLTYMKSFFVMNVPAELDQRIRECLFELRDQLFHASRLTPPEDAAHQKTEEANPDPNVPWT